MLKTVTKGVAIYHDGQWLVKLSGGLQLLIGYYPHTYLKTGRDENRKIFVAEYENCRKANFMAFCDEISEEDLMAKER